MTPEHSPGIPFYLDCGFCNRKTDTCISAADQSTTGMFPICDHCSDGVGSIINAFGTHVGNWMLVSLMHDATECAYQPEAPLSAEDALAEVERLIGGGKDD